MWAERPYHVSLPPPPDSKLQIMQLKYIEIVSIHALFDKFYKKCLILYFLSFHIAPCIMFALFDCLFSAPEWGTNHNQA